MKDESEVKIMQTAMILSLLQTLTKRNDPPRDTIRELETRLKDLTK